uniref:Uncharacterized protein n=1 Tax=Angiostrongylus cantonensis TaxID=6313 RepID=A0A0K0DKI4_ANGCA
MRLFLRSWDTRAGVLPFGWQSYFFPHKSAINFLSSRWMEAWCVWCGVEPVPSFQLFSEFWHISKHSNQWIQFQVVKRKPSFVRFGKRGDVMSKEKRKPSFVRFG